MSSDTVIQLEDLNVDLRSKFAKFDVNNDGKLTNENLVQGIVTLQKQSDTYKKTLWFFALPLFVVLLGCILGVSIGAIKLTKDSFVKNSQLIDSSGKTVVTGYSEDFDSVTEWILNNDFSTFNKIDLDGAGFIEINNAFQLPNDKILLDSDWAFIEFDRTLDKFNVESKKDKLSMNNFELDISSAIGTFFNKLNEENESDTNTNITMKNVRPRAGAAIGCRPSGICKKAR
jgi:hypothetical protein